MPHQHAPEQPLGHAQDLGRDETTQQPGRMNNDVTQASRRRLLGLLPALPLALGAALTLNNEEAGAKKRKGKGKGKGKGKRKKHRKHRRKGKGKGKKGGNGTYSPDAEERAFLDLINDHRRRHGARALRLNNQLGAAAEHHSRDMAKKNYFKHTLSNGDSAEQNIRRFGYTNYRAVGENIAAGEQNASQIFDIWQKSNEHNRNMLDEDFADIGIGRAHAKKSKYGWYWTTTFGG